MQIGRIKGERCMEKSEYLKRVKEGHFGVLIFTSGKEIVVRFTRLFSRR